MNSIARSFKYLKGYYDRVAFNLLLTIIVAILEIISLLAVVPFLKVIFAEDEEIEAVPKPDKLEIFPINDLGDQATNWVNYWTYSFMEQYSASKLLTLICIAVFIAFLLKNLFIYLNKMVDRSVRYNVAKDLRKNVYEKVLKLPIRYFSDQRRGDILTRFSNDITQIENTVLNGFSLLFKEPIMILMYLFSMLVISSKLTLFILILLPLLGLVIGRISKSLKRKSTGYQEQSAELLSTLDETMFGTKVIKSFTAENYLSKKFSKANHALKKLRKKIYLRNVSASPVSETLGIGVVMIVLWYGGNLILNNSESGLSGAMLIAYLIIFSRMISPIKSLSEMYSNLLNGLASADRIDEFLALEEEYKTLPNVAEPRDFHHKIEFRNVHFQYPGSESRVLRNFNLMIPKGSVTALVGQSGAGKSTIADLLPRFYEVKNGEIFIDDINISQIPLEQLRSMFSYVSQEAILFNDTVENNISFGIPNKSREDIIEAAKIANAHEFISTLEHGYETNVGERGSKLSGGQKQRITIARAILKNAPILILDEATSALDTESERLVQDAIDRLLEDRTALVIAHRLSTIKNADQICVMEQGEIIEQGEHNELLSIDRGHYKKLTEMQSL